MDEEQGQRKGNREIEKWGSRQLGSQDVVNTWKPQGAVVDDGCSQLSDARQAEPEPDLNIVSHHGGVCPLVFSYAKR